MPKQNLADQENGHDLDHEDGSSFEDDANQPLLNNEVQHIFMIPILQQCCLFKQCAIPIEKHVLASL